MAQLTTFPNDHKNASRDTMHLSTFLDGAIYPFFAMWQLNIFLDGASSDIPRWLAKITTFPNGSHDRFPRHDAPEHIPRRCNVPISCDVAAEFIPRRGVIPHPSMAQLTTFPNITHERFPGHDAPEHIPRRCNIPICFDVAAEYNPRRGVIPHPSMAHITTFPNGSHERFPGYGAPEHIPRRCN